jgi:hypothetical protein
MNRISCKKISVCPCGHDFHDFCIRKWLKINPTCPRCIGSCSLKSLKNKPKFPSLKCLKPRVQPEPREWGGVLGNYSRRIRTRVVPSDVIAVRDWDVPDNE